MYRFDDLSRLVGAQILVDHILFQLLVFKHPTAFGVCNRTAMTCYSFLHTFQKSYTAIGKPGEGPTALHLFGCHRKRTHQGNLGRFGERQHTSFILEQHLAFSGYLTAELTRLIGVNLALVTL